MPMEGNARGERKDWDTVKPLSKWFRRLDRVVLFDDDAHKACRGEEANMVRVPCWDDNDDKCQLIPELVESTLKVSLAHGSGSGSGLSDDLVIASSVTCTARLMLALTNRS